MTPEGRVKAKLKRHLVNAGWWQWWPVPSGYGEQMVDCVAYSVKMGMLLIETKREGVTKPTPRQAAIMRKARAYGIVTYLVTMRDGELFWIELKD